MARVARGDVAASVLLALLSVACVIPPRAEPTRPGAAAGLALAWTPDSCRSFARDRDADEVDDECELALARAFAPELIVDPRDCLWEPASVPARLGGGYLFVANRRPGTGGAVRIAYLPAYYRDCGWSGAPCLTRGRGCAAHDGDSELVVLDVRYDVAAARWVTEGLFLSAHCFGRSTGRCRWYRGDDLRRFTWVDDRRRGAPRIWVARGKHGNYPSASECDAGHWRYDSCDGNAARYRFPVVSAAQNAGSRRRPLPAHDGAVPAGCIESAALPLRGSSGANGAIECFWDATMPFRGWRRPATGAPPTSYARVIEYAAGI